MPYLKSITGYGSPKKLFNYLHYGRETDEGSNELRHLAIDTRIVSDIVNPIIEGGSLWWEHMDATYNAYDLISAKHGNGKQRHYYHFIISPNAKDHATLDEVRELANRWVDDNFPGYEVAIVYHDDNSEREASGKSGIVHAHAVINAVHPESFRKILISNERVDELTDSLQDIAKDIGLTYFDDREERLYKASKWRESDYDPMKAGSYERRILNRKGYSWKNEIREVVRATVPFCRDLDDLKRHLAPYDFGVQRIRGGLLFTNPEGHKIGSNQLGIGFKEYQLARFYKRTSFTALSGKNYASFREEIREKGLAVAAKDKELADLQDSLDLLDIIDRERIESISGFTAQKEHLRDIGEEMRKQMFVMRKELESENEIVAAAFAIKDHQSIFDEYSNMKKGSAKEAFFDEHKDELDAFEEGIVYLGERNLNPKDVLDDYVPRAKRYLALQASAEGTAQRLDDVLHGSYIANKVLAACALYENEERAERGLPPKQLPITKIKTPPKNYSAFGDAVPYWNINIKKDTYKKIKETNRHVRRNLAHASDGERRLPPYIKRDEQISHSIQAERAIIDRRQAFERASTALQSKPTKQDR